MKFLDAHVRLYDSLWGKHQILQRKLRKVIIELLRCYGYTYLLNYSNLGYDDIHLRRLGNPRL